MIKWVALLSKINGYTTKKLSIELGLLQESYL